jgi:predicted permease
MVPPETFSLLFGFMLVLALGYGLRRAGRLGPEAAGTLNLVVTDVTLPALILATLSARPVPEGVLRALLTATAGLLAALSLGSLAGRALGLPRRAQGSITLTSGFGNTGFLGIPFALGLFPGKPEAGTTAVLIDAFVNTPWLYTAGVFLARRYSEAEGQGEAGGQGEAAAKGPAVAPKLWRLLFTPPSIAVVVGLGMSLLGLHLPHG